MSFFKMLAYSFLPQSVILASMKADQEEALEHQQIEQEEYQQRQEEYQKVKLPDREYEG